MTPRDEGAFWDSQQFEQQLSALGERVRTARRSHAWSQQDLSNRTEIRRANISRIESGKNFTLELPVDPAGLMRTMSTSARPICWKPTPMRCSVRMRRSRRQSSNEPKRRAAVAGRGRRAVGNVGTRCPYR